MRKTKLSLAQKRVLVAILSGRRGHHYSFREPSTYASYRATVEAMFKHGLIFYPENAADPDVSFKVTEKGFEALLDGEY